ncbi:hypothetical protein BH10PSE6_BH10PSE6_46360 [soil metagenome]
MELLHRLEIPGTNKKIDLLRGDLAAIPADHAVDVLVLSAFPNDYIPTPNSLIGALWRKGLSIEALAEDHEEDLRQTYSCWLSKPIGPEHADLHFSRVLCYEPLNRGRASELVGDVFRALAPFTLGPPHIKSVAMPILASGDQEQPASEMLGAIMIAGFNWLIRGFPVETIKIVARPDARLDDLTARFLVEAAQLAGPLLQQTRDAVVKGLGDRRGPAVDWLRNKLPGVAGLTKEMSPAAVPPVAAPPSPAPLYDVFISYSRKDEEAAKHLHKCLTEPPHALKVFIDKQAIDIGAAWQQEIFDALENCRSTAVLYSPDFLQSKVCKEEFNIAWMRRRETDAPVFPLLVREVALPTYMRLVNYVDCCTSDTAKIADAATTVAVNLKGAAR